MAIHQSHRPTNVPVSTFCLVKLLEDLRKDDHIAHIRTEWFSQILLIHSCLLLLELNHASHRSPQLVFEGTEETRIISVLFPYNNNNNDFILVSTYLV